MYFLFSQNKILNVTYSVMDVILHSILSSKRWDTWQGRVGWATFKVQKSVWIFKKQGPYEDELE